MVERSPRSCFHSLLNVALFIFITLHTFLTPFTHCFVTTERSSHRLFTTTVPFYLNGSILKVVFTTRRSASTVNKTQVFADSLPIAAAHKLNSIDHTMFPSLFQYSILSAQSLPNHVSKFIKHSSKLSHFPLYLFPPNSVSLLNYKKTLTYLLSAGYFSKDLNYASRRDSDKSTAVREFIH